MGIPVRGKASGPAQALKDFAVKQHAKRIEEVNNYIDELYRFGTILGIDPYMVAVQSAVETDNWTSSYWNDHLNPAGIGITYSGQASHTWANGVDAARAQLVHHCAYLGINPVAINVYKYLDPRFFAVYQAQLNGSITFWEEYGNGAWAVDPHYVSAIMERKESIDAFIKKGTTMGKLSYVMHQTIVPIWQTNNRPGIKQTPLWINVHETANRTYGADAKMHSTWLLNGAPGAADAQVGVHYFVDDTEGYQMLPHNEISWNAGCGSCAGNYNAISIELCVNSDGDYDKAWRNVAELVASLMHELDINLDHVVTHNYWSGKWCPTLMLNQGLWPSFKQTVITFYNQATPAAPIYGPGQPVLVDGRPWEGKKDIVVNGITFHGEIRKVDVTAKQLSCRQWASLDALQTRKPLVKGDKISVIGWVKGEEINKENRWWITEHGTRFHAGGTKQQPTEKPANPKPPKENPYDKVVDGQRFYAVVKPIRVTVGSYSAEVYRYPKTQSEIVRKPLNKGETFTVLYWVHGEEIHNEDRWWVTANDSRVWVGHTVEKP